MVDIEMIDEEEAMRMIRVSSRVTIRKYTERYNFPKPVRTYPKQYLRSAIVEWILNGSQPEIFLICQNIFSAYRS